jgi:hypothetical protein
MKNLQLPLKLDRQVTFFIQELEEAYAQELLSVILYGSAASGEFVVKHSNLNILVILGSADLLLLKKASSIVKKFKNISPLFLTENYILSSTDVFPIEFLDMQENYAVLYGKDILKDIHVDPKNLRFQCEQELKLKLLNLKQLYIKLAGQPAILAELLLKSFTSVLHILRNVLRLKNIKPPYKKEDLLKELAKHFEIEAAKWEKILACKQKKIKANKAEIEGLFIIFVDDLEKIIRTVDAL